MVLVLVLVLASSWDAAGCFHWENQMMACSLEPCAFQAIYVQLYFSKCSRRQEIVSMLTVSGSQWTSFADTHRHTQTIICCCCLYGKEGLLSSIAPAVTSQMFPIINSIECLLPCCFSLFPSDVQRNTTAKSQPFWIQTRLFYVHSIPVLMGHLSNVFRLIKKVVFCLFFFHRSEARLFKIRCILNFLVSHVITTCYLPEQKKMHRMSYSQCGIHHSETTSKHLFLCLTMQFKAVV